MLHVIHTNGEAGPAHLRAMYNARKRVFIDLLKWDLPVLAGCYELDEFDDPRATYLILAGGDGAHYGSARLLPTLQPHLLDTYFGALCEEAPPRGESVYEITRFCLEPRLRAAERRQIRDQLVRSLVDHALAHGITTYLGVAEIGWLQQILAFGWVCRPLGAPVLMHGARLGALRIDIAPDTPARLTCAGIIAAHIDGETRHAA